MPLKTCKTIFLSWKTFKTFVFFQRVVNCASYVKNFQYIDNSQKYSHGICYIYKKKIHQILTYCIDIAHTMELYIQ